MKHIIAIGFGLFISSVNFGQWIALNSGQTGDINEVAFPSDQIGYLFGFDGISKTIDGGDTWNFLYENDSEHITLFHSGHFWTNDHGISVAQGNSPSEFYIFHTNNGGTSWETDTITSDSNPKKIYFIDDQLGFIVGSDGMVLRTTDGGDSWTSIPTPTSLFLSDIDFYSSTHGIAVGGFIESTVVLATTDGGATWTDVSDHQGTNFLQAVHFPSPNVGYAVGWDGNVLKSTDQGTSWKKLVPAQVYGNLDVFFLDDLNGYVIGGDLYFGGIQRTSDGGLTWTLQDSPEQKGLISIGFSPGGVGFASGSQGSLLKTEAEITALSNNLPIDPYEIWPTITSDRLNWSPELPMQGMDFIQIIDAMGIVQLEIHSEKTTLDLNQLEAGHYFFVASNGFDQFRAPFIKTE